MDFSIDKSTIVDYNINIPIVHATVTRMIIISQRNRVVNRKLEFCGMLGLIKRKAGVISDGKEKVSYGLGMGIG